MIKKYAKKLLPKVQQKNTESSSRRLKKVRQTAIQASLNIKSTSNDPLEKEFLYDQIIDHDMAGRVLEVGSYMGSSSFLIASALTYNIKPSTQLICIDTWQNDAMSEGQKDTFSAFQENTQSFASIIQPIRGKSQDVALECRDEFDSIFIDANHSYESCKADVEKFSPLVREQGCLIFDDHISFPGVTKVIGELLTSGAWYVGASYNNVIALYKDTQNANSERRKRSGNKVLQN